MNRAGTSDDDIFGPFFVIQAERASPEERQER
jgi:hypothetical protein